MTFLQPFELFYEAITIPDKEKLHVEYCTYDYNYGKFDIDKDRVLKSETKVKLIAHQGTSGPEYCKSLNDKTVERIKDDYNAVLENLTRLPKSPKYGKQRFFLEGVISGFGFWYQTHDYVFPFTGELIQKRKPKYQEYEELFHQFLNDDNADPAHVKKILNNKNRWSNPSQLLKNARKKAGLKASELKSKKRFAWTDPKNTAKD